MSFENPATPTAALMLSGNSDLTLSNLVGQLRSSEAHYGDQLSKLLACCSPPRQASAESGSKHSASFTSATRALAAYHVQLVRAIHMSSDYNNVENFLSWLIDVLPAYNNYVDQYNLEIGEIPMIVSLKRVPLARINEIIQYLNKIVDINEQMDHFEIDKKSMKDLIALMNKAKAKDKSENLRIDLNTLSFNSVHSLEPGYYKTVGFFKIEDVLNRDYFKLDFIHPTYKFEDKLVEVFYLLNNRIAICSVEKIGRSLLFPLLKANQFCMSSTEKIIQLINGDKVELIFRCLDVKQSEKWAKLFRKVLGDTDRSFGEAFEKLQRLKADRIGLGFEVDEQEYSKGLRKSKTILSTHPSLKTISRIPLTELSPNLSNIDNYFSNNVDLNRLNSYTNRSIKITKPSDSPFKINSVDRSVPIQDKPDIEFKGNSPVLEKTPIISPTLPLNIKKSSKTHDLRSHDLNVSKIDFNSSTTSLPNYNSSNSIEPNPQFAQSTNDLSKFDNIKPEKLKKRKSFFDLFKKKNDASDFEIVIKNPSNCSISPSPSVPSNNIIAPSTTESPVMTNSPTLSSTASTAGLSKNIKKLSINTAFAKPSMPIAGGSVSSSTSTTPTSAPSSFSMSTQDIPVTLSTTETELLNGSNVENVIKNSIIFSRWRNNKWESIGIPYLNSLKFLSSFEGVGRTMALYLPDSKLPKLIIPLSNFKTSRFAALDIQLRCKESIDTSKIMMISIRCRDSRTLNDILMNLEGKDKESMSTSSSKEIFSAGPSQSTSMSSVSVDEEVEFFKPKIPGLSSGSGSSSSTPSNKSNITLDSRASTPINEHHQMNQLLLKSGVKIKLHKQDQDGDWLPIALGKLSIYSLLTDPEFSNFQINCINKFSLRTLVKNSTCKKIGKTGLKFGCIDDDSGDEMTYLIEFRNITDVEEIYELIT